MSHMAGEAETAYDATAVSWPTTYNIRQKLTPFTCAHAVALKSGDAWDMLAWVALKLLHQREGVAGPSF